MKLAISNLAWPPQADAQVASLLNDRQVTSIEIAPTKIWPNPAEVSLDEAHRYRNWWEDRGIHIVALQSLLFGRPELTVFETRAQRQATIDYLRRIISLGSALGARVLVFGSPKNRRIGSLPLAQAQAIAREFFVTLAECALSSHTKLVIESNPTAYGADFLCHASEALQLVREVNHAGFGLHLDTACAWLSGDALADVVRSGRDVLDHVHISEPDLAPIGGDGSMDHGPFASALRAVGYERHLSIEMRTEEPFDIACLEQAIAVVQSIYFHAGKDP